jgi:hypothetical protein
MGPPKNLPLPALVTSKKLQQIFMVKPILSHQQCHPAPRQNGPLNPPLKSHNNNAETNPKQQDILPTTETFPVPQKQHKNGQ